MNQRPVMILSGELLKNGEDWDILRFGALFGRLQNKVATRNPVIRYLRYFGEAGGSTEYRFFGIVADSTQTVPDGMVSLAIGENSFVIHEPARMGSARVWEAELTWDWLDLSEPGKLMGEFTTSMPDNKPVHFILTANSYSERGKNTRDDVELAKYDPAWPSKFQEMKDWLQKNLPAEIVLRIEHYGSTAIPGTPAKPVIDILLEIPSFEKARRALIPLFNKPECEYWYYNNHIVFIIRDRFLGTRQFHIHAAPAGNRVWEGLVFRDYLIGHPEDAKRYTDLKYKLVESHASDRESYTDLKADFVREITEKALLSR